jgi:hypothetical protein
VASLSMQDTEWERPKVDEPAIVFLRSEALRPSSRDRG